MTPLDWGTDEEMVDAATEQRIRNLEVCQRYKSIDEGDTGDFPCDDHISPQVPFLSIGLIGSLIIESQVGFLSPVTVRSFAIFGQD
jgi:hypothetical protein